MVIFRPDVRLQPRRLRISSAAVGCKPYWAAGYDRAPMATFSEADS
jgi:hypothetical protein